VTAIQGYLAAIYKSIGVAVGGSTLHQLLTNPDFETGDLTGWTVNIGDTGTGTATVGDWGYGINSKGVKIVDDGLGVELEQTVTLDSALTEASDCIARCYAKLASGNTATLKVTFLDASDVELGSATRSISSTPYLGEDGDWGLWSILTSAPVDTKKAKFEVYSAAAFTWYVDNCEVAFMEQIAGAYGTLGVNLVAEAQDTTTFASAQANDGYRSFTMTLKRADEIPVTTYWGTTEEYPEIDSDTPVFVALFTQKGTVKDRFEFWAYIKGVEHTIPLEGVQNRNITLQVNGIIGATKEA